MNSNAYFSSSLFNLPVIISALEPGADLSRRSFALLFQELVVLVLPGKELLDQIKGEQRLAEHQHLHTEVVYMYV